MEALLHPASLALAFFALAGICFSWQIPRSTGFGLILITFGAFVATFGPFIWDVVGASTGRPGELGGDVWQVLLSTRLSPWLLLVGALGWLTLWGTLRRGLALMGAFTAPCATLILLVHEFFGGWGTDRPQSATSNGILSAHVALSILGEAFAITASSVALFYLWKRGELKHRKIDGFTRDLPALDSLAAFLVWCVRLGFVLFSFALITGTQVRSALGAEIGPMHFKIIWALLTWIWYLATLLSTSVFRQPIKRLAQMSLGGFFILAVAYFGLGFVS